MATDAATDDRALLAAELALGLLDGSELDDARRLQRDDPAFAAEVDRWLDRFSVLFAQWPEVEPPASLSRRVRAAAGIGAANENDSTRWKWATGVAGSVAAVLGLLLLGTPRPQAPIPPPVPQEQPQPGAGQAMAVAFSMDNGAQTLPAMVDMDLHQVRLPTGLEIPEGRVAQLWLIEGDGKPQPMGLFERSSNGLTATMTVDRDIPAGSVLAISIEPPGGSPTGQPTGPVVATGEMKPV